MVKLEAIRIAVRELAMADYPPILTHDLLLRLLATEAEHNATRVRLLEDEVHNLRQVVERLVDNETN